MQTIKTLLKKANATNEDASTATAIRAILKSKHGLSARDASVRSRSGSTSSAVTITLKTNKALVLRDEIEVIGSAQDSYSRDDATGDILSGGNTFVFIQVSPDLKSATVDKINAEYKKRSKGNLAKGEYTLLFGFIQVQALPSGSGYEIINKKDRGGIETTDDESRIGSIVFRLIRTSALFAKVK